MCQNPQRSFGTNPDEPPSPRSPEEEAREAKRQAQVEEVAWTLANGDASARIQAARNIRKIVRRSPKARSAFAVSAVIQPLVAMLPSSNHRSVESALLALLNIAVRNERNKEKIASSGAIPPLLDILRSDSNLRELATSALLSLSASKSNRPIIAASGAIPPLVKIIVSGNMHGKVDAITTLYNLSSCVESYGDLSSSAEGAKPLLALLKDSKKHSKFVDKTTAVLKILCESDEGRRAILDFECGILTLVETVEEGSLLGAENAVGILLSLCRSSQEKCRELVLNEGPIPGLLLLTVEGTKKAGDSARELLEILRKDSQPKRIESEDLETIVHDIAAKVDGPDQPEETAKKMLRDVVRRNMEDNISRLQVSEQQYAAHKCRLGQ
ncbi:U-box domain-containing protein 45 [Platanthera guangdongensis]|uniref:U-box domain-containing protein 45 n=1 Tax=Platanthera guangdongensis TaxID=2320717 RepID=A0ABR2LFP8_9ASPA